MRFAPILACLALASTVSAITPSVGSLPTVGPTVNGGDAAFLALLPTLQASFSDASHPTQAGPGFWPGSQYVPGSVRDATVYFISKDAGFDDAIGIQYLSDESLHVLFPTTTGLALGDHVTVAVGTNYNAFALTHADGSGDFWSSLTFDNVDDETSHIQFAYVTTDASGIWYTMALDDEAGGGDRDWNDVRLAWRFNDRAITTPEPATLALLAGFLAIGAWLYRRQRLALN